MRHTLIVAATLAAILAGCKSAEPKTARRADRYNIAYVTRDDIPWMKQSTDTKPAGTVKAGETVYLQDAAPSIGPVQGQLADGKMVWVNAPDLQKR